MQREFVAVSSLRLQLTPLYPYLMYAILPEIYSCSTTLNKEAVRSSETSVTLVNQRDVMFYNIAIFINNEVETRNRTFIPHLTKAQYLLILILSQIQYRPSHPVHLG